MSVSQSVSELINQSGSLSTFPQDWVHELIKLTFALKLLHYLCTLVPTVTSD